jgi:hypothetical protein
MTNDLHHACKSGNIDQIIQSFESNPSKLNEKDSKVISTQLGWTPLYRSVISGRLQATKYLLSQGADPNMLNNLGESPLHQAADSGNLELAELLLQSGADPNIQQNEGDSPLHNSAFRGDVDMVKLLLKYQADPNIQNKVVKNIQAGRTALHYAVDCGFIECVVVMMLSWADPFVVDFSGKNAFDMTQDQRILQVLKDANDKVVGGDDDRLYLERCSFGRKNNAFDDGSKNECFEDDNLHGRVSHNSDQLSEIIKLSKTTTTSASQISTNPSKFELYPIYNWLETINLAVYYELIISSNYHTLESISQDPNDFLQKLLPLLKKPGHKARLSFRVEELSKPRPRPSLQRRSKSSFLKCCGISSCNTQAVFHFPSLKAWLDHINMGVFYENFLEAGYDDYESLVLMVNSNYSLTLEKIRQELKINNENYAKKIIRELEADHLSLFSRQSLRSISFDEPKTVACESCLIY